MASLIQSFNLVMLPTEHLEEVDNDNMLINTIFDLREATAYLIGKLKIVELREKARTAMGDAFDIRDFHDEVLKDGPVPLSVLEQKIDAMIAASNAG